MRFIKRSPATLITVELTSFPCKSSVLQGPAIDYDFIKYWFYKDIPFITFLINQFQNNNHQVHK